jgi:6-pyruvoyltetrahydropterin/6-carboxytetrahydropterin synthase
MYEIAVEQEMAAGHQLRGYHGKCENCHGHNWKVRLEVKTPDLDAIGLAIDFGILKKALHEILENYDHRMLNELPEFSQDNPTSENLAKSIYRQACTFLEKEHPTVSIHCVIVWESSRAFVRYYE